MKWLYSILWVRNILLRLRRSSLQRLYKRLEERGYEIHISDDALKLLSENGYDPVYGARPLKRAIQQQIENPLAQQILSGELIPGKAIRLEANEDRIVAVQ
ncbi:chaperone protein ClpB [Enterobacter cancerogenus]|uniref:Chaperone protein ClpB n=1 Tax=Enterobacter cancerogenus TaxID=69218 RepID=A0A484Z5G6_9ENTR|nr:chaperone protein ClpB [Enterobacter cancerogenus]